MFPVDFSPRNRCKVRFIMKYSVLVFAAGLLLPAQHACAGSATKETTEAVVATPFDKGKFELQLGTGAFTSFQSVKSSRPKITDVDGVIRLGAMLYTPDAGGVLRGNCELMVDLYGAALVEGPRTGYGGASLLLRYNFVPPLARCLPYFQIQAGGAYNDIYRDKVQRIFGRDIEFNLGGGLGLRWLCSDRCAFFLEGDYRHISNCNTADRNTGLNSLGGFLGFSYFF